MARINTSTQVRYLCLLVAVLLCLPRQAFGFFGFGEAPALKESSATGCISWRQTGSCDPHNGPREPRKDKDCNVKVKAGNSGYCECVFGSFYHTDCSKRRPSIKCEQVCHQAFHEAAEEDSGEWLQGTSWNWNDWRVVTFAHDGSFIAPTPDCESGRCFWIVKDNVVYIQWGDAGIHSVRDVSSDKTRLEGMRFNGERCHAQFVRREEAPEEADDDDDLYALLGLDVEATDAEIRKAYRKLSRELHPDKYNGDDKEAAERKFIKVQHAYEILKEEETRMVYDTGGMEAVENINKEGQQGGMDPFSMFFGGGGHGGGGSKRGQAVKAQLHVTLEDLFNGAEIGAQYSRRVVCRNCRKINDKNRERCAQCERCPPEVRMVHKQMGGFLVQQQEQVPSKEKCKEEATVLNAIIEKGMSSGQELLFERMGEQTPGQVPGDVILVLEQKPHDRFLRKNHNLHTTVHISLKEALTGFTHKFLHLDNSEVTVQKESGDITAPFSTYVMKKNGMPLHNTPSEQGDLILEFQIQYPESLTPQQIELFKKILPD